ncbi:MAG TPA: hypothetical protein VGC55_15655 [Dokdonella sp.]
MRRTIYALLTTVALTSLLGGCGFVHRHFDRKDDGYRKSVNERPLEVPPDLDTPNSSGALIVPALGAGASAASVASAPPASADAATAPMSSAPPAGVAAAGGVTIGGDSLGIADSVENTWSRVGLALERSGAAKILGRDEASRTYTVQTTGQTTTRPGWFKRAITLGMASGKTTAQVQLTVRVSAEGNTSKVGIEGATDEASQDAARALLAMLRQRLS